ncbi:MAG: hypothetical protein M3P18_22180 [Actinomycetota bacterium]|nr:hypothetical protein [Actinomycetota bacterium]
MKKEQLEDKKLGDAEFETKTEETPPITAENCPERPEHRGRQGMTCKGCGEAIPSHGYYSPSEMQRYFSAPSAPPRPVSAEEQAVAELWKQYDVARQATEDAAGVLDDLKRGRNAIRGSDAAAPARGARFEVNLAAAEELFEKRREDAQTILLAIQRLGQIRKAKTQAALMAESYPPEAQSPGLADRLIAVLRGQP